MIDAIVRKAAESAAISAQFFERNATELERCVLKLATRLREGGRLFVMGNGGSGCDAQHASVEFNHPVIEKRRAFPSIALNADSALLSAIGNDTDFSQVFAQQIDLFARPSDCALGISSSGASSNVNRGMRRARELGLLTIGFAGRDGGALVDHCEFCFVVPSWSIHRIQETHTILLHLLWDQVHVTLGEPDVL